MRSNLLIFLSSVTVIILSVLIATTPDKFTRKENGSGLKTAKKTLPFAYQIIGERGMEIAGIAVIDYDRDGDLDIYLTNGTGYPNVLLANDGKGNFLDVSVKAGVDKLGGNGVVTGDLNNDGYDDIFVGGDSQNTLFLNLGDGTFGDITRSAGWQDSRGTLSSTFCDFDNDALLDIYLANKEREEDGGKLGNSLYRNNGDGTFTDIANAAGVAQVLTRPIEGVFPHNPWEVACLDYDNDGDQDILVAVDFAALTLFKNELNETGELSFTNVTLEAGLGTTGNWMGLAIADYNNDGYQDFFATNWGNSPEYEDSDKLDNLLHGLYRNNGDGTFTDIAEEVGLASWEFGWGAIPVDWDKDGYLDIYYAGNLFKRAEGNYGHLFLNKGGWEFSEETVDFGLKNSKNGLEGEARGIVSGDFNNDGFIDIVVSNVTFLKGNSEDNEIGSPILFINPGLAK